mgnify:CR=1 FL=1
MSVYNANFDNQVNQTQSMTGSNKIHVSEIDFDTSCECQITACDGGTIKFCGDVSFDPPLDPGDWHPGSCEDPLPKIVVTELEFAGGGDCQIKNCIGANNITFCSPVVFNEGFTWSGNLCNIGAYFAADNFIADTQFTLCDASSTCSPTGSFPNACAFAKWDQPVAAGRLTVLLTNHLDLQTVTDLPQIKIHNEEQGAASTGGLGIDIKGGTAAEVKDIKIQAPSGKISTIANTDIVNTAVGKIFLQAVDEVSIVGSKITNLANTGSIINTSTVGTIQNSVGPIVTEGVDGYILNDAMDQFFKLNRVNPTVNGFKMSGRQDGLSTKSELLPYGAGETNIGNCTRKIDNIFATNLGSVPCPITNQYLVNGYITNLYLDTLILTNGFCVDATIGTNKLVLKTGTANGISFSDDPCVLPLVERPVLYEDPAAVGGAVVVLKSSSGKNLSLISGLDVSVQSASTTRMISYNRTTILSSNQDVVLESQLHDVLLTCQDGSLTSNTLSTNLSSINDTNITSTTASINIAAKEWDAKVNLETGQALAGFAIELPPDEAPTNTTKQQETRVLYPTNLGSTSYTTQGVDQNARPYIIGGNGDTNPSPPVPPFPGSPAATPAINSNPNGRRIDRVNTKRTNVYIYPRSQNPAVWPVPYNPTDVWPGDQRGDIIYAYTSGNSDFNNIVQYLCVRSWDGGGNGDYWWRLRRDAVNPIYPCFFARW